MKKLKMQKVTTGVTVDDSSIKNKVDLSRRDMIKSVAIVGLSATVAMPTVISAQQTGELMPLNDPRTRFPNNQPVQKQTFPGLQLNMIPKPDCGETSYRGSGRMAGRRALITGGDSGIGRAVAIAYAREGADVAINCLPEEESDAAEVIEIIRREGRKAVAITGDLRTEEFCMSLVTRTASELGGLDVLVNNAGYGWFLPDILDHPSEKFDRTIKTNLYAPFWLSKAAVAVMKPGSSILFTSSVTAFSPASAFIDYSATKAAIVAFTSALAKQVAKRGIRVNGVAPGPVWTPMQIYFEAPDDNVENLNSTTPLGRMGHPVEMAPLYVALAEDAGSFVTGSTWSADGGRL